MRHIKFDRQNKRFELNITTEDFAHIRFALNAYAREIPSHVWEGMRDDDIPKILQHNAKMQDLFSERVYGEENLERTIE